MHDLTTRLREDFEEIVRDLTPPDHLDELVRRRRRQRVRRRRDSVSGLLVAGLAVAVVAARLVPGDDDPSTVVAGSPDEVVDHDPLFLMPATVPPGFDLLEASGGDQPGITVGVVPVSDWQTTQRWVRYDAAREHPTEILDVRWSHVRSGGTLVVPGQPLDDRPTVTLPNGTEVAQSPTTGEVFASVDGTMVGLRGVVATANPEDPPTPLPVELLTAALASFEADDEAATLTSPPEGFELAGQWTRRADAGTNPRVLSYGDPTAERGFQLQVVDDSEIPPAASIDSVDDRLVIARGNEALLADDLLDPPSLFAENTLFLASGVRYLQWVEPGGERVTIGAAGMSDDEVLAVAESLEVIDADTWFGLQA